MQPVAYWSFDGSGAVVEDLAGDNDGRFGGTARRTSGLRGEGAALFNELSQDQVNVGNGNGAFDFSDGITIQAVILPSAGPDISRNHTIFRKDDPSRILFAFQDSGATLAFGINDGTGYHELDMPLDGQDGRPTLDDLKDGTPHHVAAVYDSESGFKGIYVDGTLRFSMIIGAGVRMISGGAKEALIGSFRGLGHAFRGVIDEVAVWGGALSAGQIKALGAGTSPLELSAPERGNRFHLSLQNDANNGSAIPAAADGPVLSFGLHVGGTYSELDMPLDGAEGRPTLWELTDGNPHHVVASYDASSGTKSLFIDGVLRFSTTLGGSIDSGGDGLAFIGNSDVGGPDGFHGTIDELVLYDRALPGADVSQHAARALSAENYFDTSRLSVHGKVLFNEVAASGEPDFFVEMIIHERDDFDLSGMKVVSSDGGKYTIPPGTMRGPDQLLSITGNDLGFTVADGDRLYLRSADDRSIADAVVVDHRLRGRSDVYPDLWLFPLNPTPGVENLFDLNEDIVINEIQYHPKPMQAHPAVTKETTLVPLDGKWEFEDTGVFPGTDWNQPGFVPDGWSHGVAPLGHGFPTDYVELVLSDGPLAYWRLGEDGMVAFDESGNGHDGAIDVGVVTGESDLVTTNSDGAMRIAGDKRIVAPAFEKFPPGSTGYTLEYWLTINTPPTGLHNIVGDYENGGDLFLANYLTSDSRIRAHQGAVRTITSGLRIQVGQTYHIVSTYDITAGRAAIYINGKLDAISTATQNLPSNTDNRFFIGTDIRSDPGGDITLDEVAIFNYPFDGQRVAEHFVATQLAEHSSIRSEFVTHYFRKEFPFEGDAEKTSLELDLQADDGAVVYLNGSEVYRKNVSVEDAAFSTLADADVRIPQVIHSISIPAKSLRSGQNVLAVELHQSSTDNDDALLAVELRAMETVAPAVEYSESDEEWLELYNRSAVAVDLAGWSIDHAVDFEFTEGTILEPGGYLVVTRDATSMRAKYPAVQIVGDFSGRLADGDDETVLRDAVGNPADIVHYFDGGRWDPLADGWGASLELRDPHADNSVAESWAASDESDRAPWQTVTYSGIADNGLNKPDGYHELILGLLGRGVVLIDDVRVVEDPHGEAISLIQNGDFQSDIFGVAPQKWRIVGNHRGIVIADPKNPDNRVLRIVATGSARDSHDHAETTLKNGNTFIKLHDGTQYEISFRAKWISGSNRINSRLYFNRLPRTTLLDVPELTVTPGAPNSVLEENLGPTYTQLAHAPATPSAGHDILVSVAVYDADSIGSMTLWYAVNGKAWMSTPMFIGRDRQYAATIPGGSARDIIQFYVEGVDGAGAASTFPAAGPQSRALLKVLDNTPRLERIQNMQILMTPADEEFLLEASNISDNLRVGATIVHEGKVFYDAGVRLRGRFSRGTSNRGYSIAFHPDHLFRDVHALVTIDRTEFEMLTQQILGHAGGVPNMVNDLVQFSGPGTRTGTAMLQLARYEDVYLDSQFKNGADGPLYHFDIIYFPTTTADGDVEGLKNRVSAAIAIPIMDLGDDEELYRYNFQLRNAKRMDDFTPVIELVKTLGLSGDALLERADDVFDVDQWMRTLAALALIGVGDNFVNTPNGLGHNAQFYQWPSDGKFVLLPWDLDRSFRPIQPLVNNLQLANLVVDPANLHHYYGHVVDIINTTFNVSYFTPWVKHFGDLLPAEDFSRLPDVVERNGVSALDQIQAAVPRVDFAIETSDDPTFVVGRETATVDGTAWVDVRTIRLAGTERPLDVTWTTADRWQITLPVALGENSLALQAYDFQGQLIAENSLLVYRTDRTGDANGDGEFSQADLDRVFAEGLYETSQPATWQQGDWNGDGQFTFEDILFALSDSQSEADQQPSVVESDAAGATLEPDGPTATSESEAGQTRLDDKTATVALKKSDAHLEFHVDRNVKKVILRRNPLRHLKGLTKLESLDLPRQPDSFRTAKVALLLVKRMKWRLDRSNHEEHYHENPFLCGRVVADVGSWCGVTGSCSRSH